MPEAQTDGVSGTARRQAEPPKAGETDAQEEVHRRGDETDIHSETEMGLPRKRNKDPQRGHKEATTARTRAGKLKTDTQLEDTRASLLVQWLAYAVPSMKGPVQSPGQGLDPTRHN